jgi:hypothetical protein
MLVFQWILTNEQAQNAVRVQVPPPAPAKAEQFFYNIFTPL